MQEVLTSLGLWPLYLLVMVIKRRLKRGLTRAQNGSAQATKDALKHVRRLKRYLCSQVFADFFTSASASVGIGLLDSSRTSQPPSSSTSTSSPFDGRQNQNGIDPYRSSPPKRAREGPLAPLVDVDGAAALNMNVNMNMSNLQLSNSNSGPVSAQSGEQHSSLISLTRPGLAARPLSGRDTDALSRLGPSRFIELYFSHKFRRLIDMLSSEFAASTSTAQPRQRFFPHLQSFAQYYG